MTTKIVRVVDLYLPSLSFVRMSINYCIIRRLIYTKLLRQVIHSRRVRLAPGASPNRIGTPL